MIYPVLYPSGAWGDSVIAFLNMHISNNDLPFVDGPHMKKVRYNMPTTTSEIENCIEKVVGAVHQPGCGHIRIPELYYNYLSNLVKPVVVYSKDLCGLGKQRIKHLIKENKLAHFDKEKPNKALYLTSQEAHDILENTINSLNNQYFHVDIFKLFVDKDLEHYNALCNYMGVDKIDNVENVLEKINLHCEIDKWREMYYASRQL